MFSVYVFIYCLKTTLANAHFVFGHYNILPAIRIFA